MQRLQSSGRACTLGPALILSMSLGLAGGVVCSIAWAQAPGPELFAKEPRTPLELWDAIDYLLRTNQPQKALPYIDRFVKSKPDDATLIRIRNRYGPGSILRLGDDPITRSFAQPMAEAMVAASHKYATQPERVTPLVAELTKTPEAQDYAVRHLREAGPDAIPSLVQAISQPGLSANDRSTLVHSMGRLDHSVLPPLIALLNSPDNALATDAATALGLIGHKDALPFLTFPAALTAASRNVSAAARTAIQQITGRPFAMQSLPPTQVLINAAWRYHRHLVELGHGPVTVWAWDNEQKTLTSRQVSRSEAEGLLGLQLAQRALRLDPNSHEAKVVQLSLVLEKAIERAGFNSFPTKDQVTFNSAKSAGPSILSNVLKRAVTDHKAELAAVAATALGQTIDRSALNVTGRPYPLVQALYAPARYVQFAAAKALVELAPANPFPGASRVVPTLARFVMNQALPRAIVIDSNPTRGSQLAGFLISLGYDSELELSGARGFQAAAESADVELILISYDLFQSGWALTDTLANLASDSRTAAIPVFVYGPLNEQYKHPNLERNYPGIRFLVQPINADVLRQQLRNLPGQSSETTRTDYALEAAKLLARVAAEPKSPFFPDLRTSEPAIALALDNAQTASDAATALREVSVPDAQRSLADIALDPSKTPTLRKLSAAELVHSIQRFGRLVTASQEGKLATAIREEADADVRTSLLAVRRVLIPQPPRGAPKRPNSPIP